MLDFPCMCTIKCMKVCVEFREERRGITLRRSGKWDNEFQGFLVLSWNNIGHPSSSDGMHRAKIGNIVHESSNWTMTSANAAVNAGCERG